jgi:hypothetical protein
LRLKSGHAALLVVHLAWLNFAPRALPGLISGSNAAIIDVLTGPSQPAALSGLSLHSPSLVVAVVVEAVRVS